MQLETETKFQRMEYRPLGTKTAPAGPEGEMATSLDAGSRALLQTQVQELHTRMKEREALAQKQVEESRREGMERGRREAEEAAKEQQLRALQRIESVLGSFAAERDAYFSKVEHEVVQLALAIAGRILRREAQLDPLLLSGAVRVALGQLAESTAVKLRVPAAELPMWEEMLRLMPNLPLRPEVFGEDSFAAGDCVLETHLGSVDLGVRTQLVEIERGFFDLLEQRPQPSTSGQEGA